MNYWQPCRKKYEESCGSYLVCELRVKVSTEITETDDDLIITEKHGQCTCFETKRKEELRQKTWNSWIKKLTKAPIFDNILSINNK